VKKRTYRQLTPEQRHTIQIMRQAGNSQVQIARALNLSASTISRELRRNGDMHGGYEHEGAHQRAVQRREKRRGHHPRTQQVWPTVVSLLSERFTASHIGLFRWLKISERSCYRLIATDRAAGGQVYRCLPRGRRPRRRVCRHRRGPIPNRRDISERSAAANDRRQFGHWEGDLVEGRNARSYLLVLRERKSRWCRIQKLPNKRSDTVTAALMGQLRLFRFRSITLDNGGEFAGHAQVAAALGRPRSVFFARPYRASDKGSVEQLNGLIRRRYPKGTDFRKVDSADLDALRSHLNIAPLKVTGGHAPIDFIHHLLPETKPGRLRRPDRAGRKQSLLPCTPP